MSSDKKPDAGEEEGASNAAANYNHRDHALEMDVLEQVLHDEIARDCLAALETAPRRPAITDERTPGKGATQMPAAPGEGLSAAQQATLEGDRGSASSIYSFARGISPEVRRKLQEKYGLNKLTPAKTTPEWLKFVHHLTGFFSLLLWAGAALCFFGYGLRGDLDNLYLGIVLAGVVLITGIFSYAQDAKAGNLMNQFASLMENLVSIRGVENGEVVWRQMPATNLVRGDVIRLESGDVVPADIRVLECENLGVSNAPLTGEPDDIEMKTSAMGVDTSPQDFKNTCFFGTNVTKGTGVGIVTQTGDDTFMGMVALLTMNTKTQQTPINKEIEHFILIVSTVAIILGVGFFCVGVALGTDLITNLVFAIGIIVANVPEGLLATVTVCLSLTAKSMATQMVLVKNMEGVETLGSTTCICSDKTGTLTQNMMTFANLVYDCECFETELVHPDTQNPLPQCDRASPTFNLFLDCIKLNTTALFAPEDVKAAAQVTDPLIDTKNQRFMLFKRPINGEVPKLVGWAVKGDASESAMVRFAQYMSFANSDSALVASVDKVVERRGTTSVPTNIAFSSALKYHMMLRRDPTKPDAPYTVYLKGAAERVLDRCDKVVMQGQVVEMTPALRNQINDRLKSMMAKGRRCLGFSYLPLDGARYRVQDDGTDYPFESADIGRNFPMGDTFKNCDELTAENHNNPEYEERKKGLIFVGIACLIDPPRPAVPKAVSNCQQAGIRVVMVTGDHPLTARAIAKLVNIVSQDSEVFDEVVEENCAAGWPDFGPKRVGNNINARADTAADAREVLATVLTNLAAENGVVPDPSLSAKQRPAWLAAAIAKANAAGGAAPSRAVIDDLINNMPEWRDPCLAPAIVVAGHQISDKTTREKWEFILSHDEIVFARTSPAQKLQIVKAFQELENEIVAVTGDGVNDAPALKKANIGVAMGVVGTDVAREAADMILLDDNFASIVRGVEEGRLIFDNLKKSIAYTLSSNIPEISPFLCFITVGTPLPLSTVLILCIDLGTDMVPAISMAWERAEADIMRRPPRNSSVDRLVTRKLVCFAYLQIGVIQAVAGFFTWFVVLNDYGYAPHVLPGLGFFDNWGKQILYCKVEGGGFRTEGGAMYSTFAENHEVTFAEMKAAFENSAYFWDPMTDGEVVDCIFASKNVEGAAARSNGDLDRAIPDTMIHPNGRLFTEDLAQVSKQSIEAVQAGNYFEFIPWRARLSPFYESKWMSISATDKDIPGLGDVDASLSFGVQNIGYYDITGHESFCGGEADGMTKANDLLRAYDATISDKKCSRANITLPTTSALYEGSRRYGATWSDGGSYKIRVASRMMQKEALHHAQCAYFVSIVVVQWADLMICKTRWLSIFHQGMINPAMNFGLVFETILAAYICYTPGVGDALGTRPIRLTHWAPAIPFSVAIFLYDEIRKKIMRDTSPVDTEVDSKQIFLKYGWVARQTYY